MDDYKCSNDDMLERILQDPDSMPRVMQLEYLKRITDNFSDERLLGEGGFGKVYEVRLNDDVFSSSHICVINLIFIYPEIGIHAC